MADDTSKPRVVLDTSLVIAGALSFEAYVRDKYVLGKDPDLSLDEDELESARIFAFALTGAVEVIVTEDILREVTEVLERPHFKKQFDAETLDVVGYVYREEGILVKPKQRVSLCRDDNDNFLLEAVIAGQAQYLITIDKDLLSLAQFDGCRIVSPKEFRKIHDWVITGITIPGSGKVFFTARRRVSATVE